MADIPAAPAASPPGQAPISTPSVGSGSAEDPSQRILMEVLKEQAYQDLADRLKEVEAELEKERAEKAAILAEKKDLAFTNEQLQEANKTAQISYTSTNSEVKNLKARIEILVNEKKELREDVEALRQKSRSDDDWIRKLRDQIESDGRTIRTLDSERSQAVADKDRFEHNHNILSAALETVRAEVKLYSDALVNKDAEFASYRTSHYAELQRLNLSVDGLNVEVANLKMGKAEAQRQYEAKTTTVEQLERDKEDLQAKLDQYTKSFRDESSKLQAAITNLELRAAEDRDSVEEFEKALRQSDEQHAAALEELQLAVDDATRARDAAITRMREMEEAVDKLSSAISDGHDGGISATAQVLTEARESGQTIGQIYINSARNGLALTKANEEVDRLQAVLKEVLMEIQAKAPELKQQRKDFEKVKAEADRLVLELSEAQQARRAAEATLQQTRARNGSLETEAQSVRVQVADLTLQVRALLREVAIRDDPSLAYEAFDNEEGREGVEPSDIDLVITSNLTAFRKLPELLEQNKKLLRISREMGRKLEASSRPPAIRSSDFSMSNDEIDGVMAEAQDVIYALREEMDQLKRDLVDVRAQSDVFAKERDLFSRMLVQSRVSGHANADANGNAIGLETHGDMVNSILDSLQQQFDQHRESFRGQISALEARLKDSGESLRSESERLTSALKSLAHEQKQNERLRDSQSTDRTTIQSHIATIAQRDAGIEQLLQQSKTLSAERDTLRRDIASLQVQINASHGAKAIYEQNEFKRAEELRKLADERATLRMQLSNRDTLRGQELENLKLKRSELERANEQLERDVASARAEVAKEREAHQVTQGLVRPEQQQALREALSSAQARIGELEALEREAAARRTAEIASLQERVSRMAEELKASSDTLVASKQEAARYKEIGLKNQRSKQEGERQLNAVRAELNAQTERVSTLQAEVVTLSAENAKLQALLAGAGAAPVADLTSGSLLTSDQSETIAALEAEVQRLRAMLAAIPPPQATAAVTSDQVSREEHSVALAKAKELGDALAAAQGSLVEAQKERDAAKLDIERLAAAKDREVEAMQARIAALEGRPQNDSNGDISVAPSPALANEQADVELHQARGELIRIKAEYDAFRLEQGAKYDADVKKVNAANRGLVAARDKRDVIIAEQAQVRDNALAELRAELEERHQATIAKLAQPSTAEQDGALQKELEETKRKLLDALTSAARHKVVESTLARKSAEIDKLKAELAEYRQKQLEAIPADAVNKKLSVKGSAIPAAGPSALPPRPPPSSVTEPGPSGPLASGPTPAATRGRNIIRGGTNGTRAGARGGGRGGAAGAAQGRSGMLPSAILAAAGYPKQEGSVRPPPGQTQAGKRRASQTTGAQDGGEVKRVKTEETQPPGP